MNVSKDLNTLARTCGPLMGLSGRLFDPAWARHPATCHHTIAQVKSTRETHAGFDRTALPILTCAIPIFVARLRAARGRGRLQQAFTFRC